MVGVGGRRRLPSLNSEPLLEQIFRKQDALGMTSAELARRTEDPSMTPAKINQLRRNTTGKYGPRQKHVRVKDVRLLGAVLGFELILWEKEK